MTEVQTLAQECRDYMEGSIIDNSRVNALRARTEALFDKERKGITAADMQAFLSVNLGGLLQIPQAVKSLKAQNFRYLILNQPRLTFRKAGHRIKEKRLIQIFNETWGNCIIGVLNAHPQETIELRQKLLKPEVFSQLNESGQKALLLITSQSI